MLKVELKQWRIANAFDDMVRSDDKHGVKIMLKMMGVDELKEVNRLADKIMATGTKIEVDEIVKELSKEVE